MAPHSAWVFRLFNKGQGRRIYPDRLRYYRCVCLYSERDVGDREVDTRIILTSRRRVGFIVSRMSEFLRLNIYIYIYIYIYI